MEYLIGGLLAAAPALHAGAVGIARDRSRFPAILIVSATGYVPFVAMGGSVPALWKDSAIGLPGTLQLGIRRLFGKQHD